MNFCIVGARGQRRKQVTCVLYLFSASGATSGNQVAQFIAGGHAESSGQSERVLDRLTRPAAGPAPTVEVSEPKSAVDETRLAGLTKTAASEAVASGTSTSPASAPAAPADLSKANEKLSGLLGGPKK